MAELTPKQIVKELDKYIIGQDKAKRSVAIALRNRYRREKLTPEIRDEIMPKNILMIGATGIGKTEIARRLAKLAHAPFIKIEATKFTEVGYVGRDVESMIRDLVEISVQMMKNEKMKDIKDKVESLVTERLLDMLQPKPRAGRPAAAVHSAAAAGAGGAAVLPMMEQDVITEQNHQIERIRERLRAQLLSGELEGKLIDIDVEETKFPVIEIFAGSGMEEMGMHFKEMLGGVLPKKRKKKKMTISEARRILADEEMEKLIDMDTVVKESLQAVEQRGIVFLDELDKIVGSERGSGPDVSREGVQRDLLPIIEGSTVMTKYGSVTTDHILFIAAGAFHVSKPSDLIPELQGRFPIRVELENLTKEDFERILLEPKNALIKQYEALIETEGTKLIFKRDAISEIAAIASKVNEETENIGARRLHTILEKVLEEISFHSPDAGEQSMTITAEYVRERLIDIVKDKDLSRYIL